MAGLSGSGKSKTAQALAIAAGAIRLRSDAIRKHIAGISIHEKGSDDIYTPAMSDKTYTHLIELGVQLASQGYRVILDAKFDRKAKRQEAIAAAQSRNIALTFLHCTAPKEVLEARLNKREGDIADATAAILAKQSMEPFDESTSVKVINTHQPKAVARHQLADVFSTAK
ncbi:MAG: AAA family ATPase [Phormidesmis sp.]